MGTTNRFPNGLRTAVAVLLLSGGGLFGGYALGACGNKCDGVLYFHTIQSPGGSGKKYKILTPADEECHRIWRTADASTDCTSGNSKTKKYREVVGSQCSYSCYMNGGLWAKATCSNAELTGDELDIECWSTCGQCPGES